LSVLTSDGVSDNDNVLDDSGSKRKQHYRSITKQLRDVERATIMDLRSRNEVSDRTLRDLEHELDLLDLRASGV